MASVSHQGMTSPAPIPLLRRQIAPKISGPDSVSLVAGHPTRARAIEKAHRRVSLFFWPMRASSCHHKLYRSTPFGSLARHLRQFGGEVFLKASTAS